MKRDAFVIPNLGSSGCACQEQKGTSREQIKSYRISSARIIKEILSKVEQASGGGGGRKKKITTEGKNMASSRTAENKNVRGGI